MYKKTEQRNRKPRFSHRLIKIAISSSILILASTILLIKNSQKITILDADKNCQEIKKLDLKNNFSQEINGVIKKSQRLCYYFYGESGKIVNLQSNTNIVLVNPNKKKYILQGKSQIILPEPGIYSIIIQNENDTKNYQISIALDSQNEIGRYVSHQPPIRLVTNSDYNHINSQHITYNLVNEPTWMESQKLKQIINDIVLFVGSKGLPINRLSISLIDLDNSECCYYAGYLDQEPRFPASVVKLFWMVELFAQYKAEFLKPQKTLDQQLKKMIQDSNNESASLIVDTITRTNSGTKLTGEELQQWMQKRLTLNLFFERAGYSRINISQKVFPTSYQKNDQPSGRDLQMRKDEFNPIRDYTTTRNVARLLFEIEKEKSISQKFSQQMKKLLKRSLYPKAWKNKEYNAISGFLGESLPRDTYFASKMGWNFTTRNDAAIIGSPDGKHKYILVVFGDDPSFYRDKEIFPQLSRRIYEKMTN